MTDKAGTLATQAKVQDIIFQVIDELNRDPKEAPIVKGPETVLLGPSSVFDSLRLVNLIVAVEQKVEEEFGFPISAIANEKAMSRKSSPLRTVSTLAGFITSILEEKA